MLKIVKLSQEKSGSTYSRVVLCLIIAVAFGGCGLFGPRFTISGRYSGSGLANVQSDRQSNRAVPRALGIDYDEIWAFPLVSDYGMVAVETVTDRQVFSILHDGTFEVSVRALVGHDKWILVAADPGQPDLRDQLARYISIPDQNGSSLTLIKTQDLIDNLGLGDVTDDGGDEGLSTATIEDIHSAFGELSSADLSSIARADDAVRTGENFWRNYDQLSGEVFEIKVMSLISSLATKADVVNQMTSPTDYSLSMTFEFNFRTNQGDGDAEKLVAPDATEYSVGVSPDGGTFYSYFSTANFPTASIPAGDWSLLDSSGALLAVADFGFAVPMAANDLPVGLIPAVCLDVDASQIVQSVSVDWYFNDAEGQLILEPNRAAVNEALLGAFVQYNGGGQNYPDTGGTFECDLLQVSFPFDYGPDGMHVDDLVSLEFKFGTPAVFWEMGVF